MLMHSLILGAVRIKNGSIDTRGAKDVTIDGDIYILLPNGTVKKFTDGSSQEFAITNIDPPLVSGTRIFTYTDLTYLYVLDTAEKRLLILEKNGKLVKQITSTSFTQPTDMIIDEASKTAYIIDGTAIVRISL